MRHPVECRATYQQLRRLPVEAARTDSLAENRLDAKDLCLRQAALVVVALALPRGTPCSSNRAQILIAAVSLTARVAVLPNARRTRGGIAARAPRSRSAV
jgi:hypothetical protein